MVMKVERLLAIIIIMSQRGMVRAKDLARDLEVSERTIYRDIESICEAGIPVASMGGNGGGYYLMENYNLDNIFLNKDELGPLTSVVENLTELFGKDSKFKDILIKINGLKENTKEQCSFQIDLAHFTMKKELKDYLCLADKAISESKLLIFDYVNRRMEWERRVVEPYEVEFSDGQWYIIGYCRSRKSFRIFRIVRIKSMALGENFEKKTITYEEINKILNKGYEEKSILVTLKFSERIGSHLCEHFSKEKIQHLKEGGFLVKNSYPDDEGLLKFILNFGVDCEILEPVELRTRVKEYIKSVADKYQ